MSLNGPCLNFFDVLQQTGFSKSPKGPPLTILKICALGALDIAPTLDADNRRLEKWTSYQVS